MDARAHYDPSHPDYPKLHPSPPPKLPGEHSPENFQIRSSSLSSASQARIKLAVGAGLIGGLIVTSYLKTKPYGSIRSGGHRVVIPKYSKVFRAELDSASPEFKHKLSDARALDQGVLRFIEKGGSLKALYESGPRGQHLVDLVVINRLLEAASKDGRGSAASYFTNEGGSARILYGREQLGKSLGSYLEYCESMGRKDPALIHLNEIRARMPTSIEGMREKLYFLKDSKNLDELQTLLSKDCNEMIDSIIW